MHVNFSSRSGLLQSAAAAVAALVIFAACSDGIGTGGSNEASLSFAVNGSRSAAVVADASNIVVQGTGGHAVDLTSADLVIDDVVFERSHASDDSDDIDDRPDDVDDDTESDSDSDEGDNVGFHAGAATVSLPLQGGTITPFTGALPVGTYHRVSMKPQYVRLRGTVDGAPFDVTVPVQGTMRIPIEPPLVVDANSGPANVTINIDVTKWLVDANGNVIDPRQLATDTTLRRAFQKRVRGSLHAFDDHDR